MATLWDILTGKAMQRSCEDASKTVKEASVEAYGAHRDLEAALNGLDATDKTLEALADSMRRAGNVDDDTRDTGNT